MMALALFRTRFSHRSSSTSSTFYAILIHSRCALRQKRAAISVVRAASSSSRPGLCRPLLVASGCSSRRAVTTGRGSKDEDDYLVPDPLTKSASVEEIRLRKEFEETKDIRGYLRKWQERHSNVVDPVRGPGTSNAFLDPARRWIGNMLNDNRESHDAGSDALRLTDEDSSEFSQLSDEGESATEYLQPGDLVALQSTDGLLSFAIYVRSVHKQQQFYTERGKWRVAFPKEIDYVIKDFAPQKMVEPLHPYFPDSLAFLSKEMQSVIEGGVPRSAGGELLRKVDEFKENVDGFYRKNVNRLDHLHTLVSDDQEKLGYTLEEIATKALGIDESELDNVILFAVHRAVRRNTFLIDNDKSSLFSNYYLVQPKRVAEVVNTVSNWVHEHQEYLLKRISNMETGKFSDHHPLQNFLRKAQRLILRSRKVRSPTTMASVGPTTQRYQPGDDGEPLVFREVETEKFNGNDKKIIEYLQLYCIPPRQMTSGSLRSAGSHIMRSTGMYNTLGLTAASMPLFLQELGVISPWENLRLLDQSLALPGHGISARSDTEWEKVLQECETINSNGVTDSMQHMRTDWGDLPIYCVDDPGAHEIDDGMSLDRIPGSNDTFWVRVHIANPSAFIPPDNPIIQYAASQCQTLYVPEQTYPMLPNSLTQEHFSLAAGRPTITFSAKMNLKGEVLDTNIVHGTARNVVYIAHDTLREFLEPHREGGRLETLQVGGEATGDYSRPGLKGTLSEEEKDTFQTLRQLMLGFREWRRKNGAMEFPVSEGATVSVNSGNAPMKPYNMRDIDHGRCILGDPIIQLEMRDTDPHEVPDLSKRNLVSLLMNLACWVSGKWCATRNIPVVYDGTWYHPEYPQLTKDTIVNYGGSNWLNYVAPKAISSSEAIHHVPLGLDAYVKSTSPLRRYTDLLAHYQIEAALRLERANQNIDTSATTTETTQQPQPTLPFSKDSIETHIDRTRWKKFRLRSCESTSRQFWACMLLFRAFYFGECALPETFRCLLHKPYSHTALGGTEFGEGYAGVIASMGVRCQVVFGDDGVGEKGEDELERELERELELELKQGNASSDDNNNNNNNNGRQNEIGGDAEANILSVVEGRILGVDLARMLVILKGERVVKRFERVGEWR